MPKSIEVRIENLETVTGGKEPAFIFVHYEGTPEIAPEMKERLCEEAVSIDPGKEFYIIPCGCPWRPQEPPSQTPNKN